MLSGPIYHINKLNKAIFINNQAIQTIEININNIKEMENKLIDLTDYKENDLEKKYYGKYDEFERKFIKGIVYMIRSLKETIGTSNNSYILKTTYKKLIEVIKEANYGCEELKNNLEMYKYIYSFIYLCSIIIIFQKKKQQT